MGGDSLRLPRLSDFADRKLREENLRLKFELTDERTMVIRQADVIRQMRNNIKGGEVRPCLCGPVRWEHWANGRIAGPDQVVGTADDLIRDTSKLRDEKSER